MRPSSALSPRRSAALMPFPRPFPSETPYYPVLISVAGQGRKGFVDGHRLGEAYFFGPLDACHLPDFSFIVTDGRNNCLRRMDLQTEIVTTLSTHAFLGPRSPVVIDGGAAIVLCDSGHNKIRMVQLAPGDPGRVIQDCTIAGTGRQGHLDGCADAASFARPVGLCIIHDGSILVVDSLNHAIRRIAGRPGRQGLFVTTILGGLPGFMDGDEKSARLNNPSAIVVDAQGTVLIADAGNAAVRALHLPPGRDASATHGWALTTVCGDGSMGYSDGLAAGSGRWREPVALALGGDGELLVTDACNHAVRAVVPLDSLGSSATTPLNSPSLPHGGGLFRVSEKDSGGGSALGSAVLNNGMGGRADDVVAAAASASGMVGVMRVGDLRTRAPSAAGPCAHWTIVGPPDTLRLALQSPALQLLVDAAVTAAENLQGSFVDGESKQSPVTITGGDPLGRNPPSGASAVMPRSAAASIALAASITGESPGEAGEGNNDGYEHASRLIPPRGPPVHPVPYFDPAAVLAVHARYGRVVTVAGAPPAPASFGAPTLPVRAGTGKGFADGHATIAARLNRPHGLCVLSGGVGGSVLIADAGNNLMRLLVSKATMDAQPLILRPIIPADAIALARQAIIKRRAELIASAPIISRSSESSDNFSTLSPRSIGGYRHIGWPSGAGSVAGSIATSGSVSKRPSFAQSPQRRHSTAATVMSITHQMRSEAVAAASSSSASVYSGPLGDYAQNQQQQLQYPAATTVPVVMPERLLAHTQSSMRRVSRKSSVSQLASTAVGPHMKSISTAAAPYEVLVAAAAPPLAGGFQMTLEDIANGSSDAPAIAGGSVPTPSSLIDSVSAGGVTMTRTAAAPIPSRAAAAASAAAAAAYAAAATAPAVAASAAVTPELGAFRSMRFATTAPLANPRDVGWAAAPFTASREHAAPSMVLRSPLGRATDSTNVDLLASTVLSSQRAEEDKQSRRSSVAASVSSQATGRMARLVPAPADHSRLQQQQQQQHQSTHAAQRQHGESDIYRAAAHLVNASVADAGTAGRPSPASLRKRLTAAAARHAMSSSSSSNAYPGTTGPSNSNSKGIRVIPSVASASANAAAASRANGGSAGRLRSGGAFDAFSPAAFAELAAAMDSGVGGAPVSHDSHHAGTHTPGFWTRELCPGRNHVVVNEWFSSRDAIAHEEADATGAVVQALLLSNSSAAGSASTQAGLLNARFTRHTASSAASLRARGRSVVRLAPAFVNVSAMVTRKLDSLRSNERTTTAAAEARSSTVLRASSATASHRVAQQPRSSTASLHNTNQHDDFYSHEDAALLSASQLVSNINEFGGTTDCELDHSGDRSEQSNGVSAQTQVRPQRASVTSVHGPSQAIVQTISTAADTPDRLQTALHRYGLQNHCLLL